LTRAYQTRHGAGPLPSFDAKLDARLSDPGNPANAWQGALRHGWLDLVLLRYAVESAGGSLDGLVVNHLDDLAGLSPRVCVGYRLPDGSEIERLPISVAPSLSAQERLTALLGQATALYDDVSSVALVDRLAAEFGAVVLAAHGPTWHDRELRELSFRTLARRAREEDRSASVSLASESG
jgi:adenylosuccinate synthase